MRVVRGNLMDWEGQKLLNKGILGKQVEREDTEQSEDM
jgi:hypothetical protein